MNRFLPIVSLLVIACAPSATEQPSSDEPAPHPFPAKLEEAHGMQVFAEKEVLVADLSLRFGGKQRMKGTLAMSTDSRLIHMDLESGVEMWYEDGKGYLAPDSTEMPGARFNLLTWPYFLLAPFKFGDPGALWSDEEPMMLDSTTVLPAAQLTFADEVGDSPEDWYYAFRGEDGYLEAVAYVVTFGRSLEQAEKEPHSLVYSKETRLEGVTLATHWDFYVWHKGTGNVGEKIGEADLSNLHFVSYDDHNFSIPDGAKEIPSPS